MRILIACYFNHPLHTGVSNYMNQLASGLVKAGHTVDILAEDVDGGRYYVANSDLSERKFAVTEPLHRIAAHRVRQAYGAYSTLPPWILEYEIKKYTYELAAEELIDWAKYDLVHAQEVHSLRVLSRLKPKRVPLVATLHGCVADETLLQFGYESLPGGVEGAFIEARERFGILSADLAIVPSAWLKHVFVERFGIPDGQIRVVHHGMDVDAFLRRANQKASFSFPKEKKVIFCHARLDPFKGHQILLDALAKLKKRRQDWRCYLAGDGSERHRLEEQVTRLGLSQEVVFLGDRSDIASLLNQADIMVQSSLKEAWGFTVTEAIVAGKAVVCTNVGGFKEMVQHNQTGLLVPPRNAQALANSLERLLGNRKLRLRLGRTAKVWGRAHLAMERMTRDTLRAYEEAFTLQRSGPSELLLSIMDGRNHENGVRRNEHKAGMKTSLRPVSTLKLWRANPALARLYTRNHRLRYRKSR